MKETELKPCPFCDGEAVLEFYKARKGYEAVIQCNGRCLAHIHTITHDAEEEAIEAVVKAWNRRADKARCEGKWLRRGNEKKCSCCTFIYYSNNYEWSFCPNCGAKMKDGEKK